MRKRPNIIFILTDDQGPWALGKETPELITPNLDRMADEGIRFTNFFCASPVCSPARAVQSLRDAFLRRMAYTTGFLPAM